MPTAQLSRRDNCGDSHEQIGGNLKFNDRQKEFFKAKSRYVAYGGARGGGKSWAVRIKAMLLCLNYPKIRVMIIRRTFSELRENHILNLSKMLNGIANYSDTRKVFTFDNGSTIHFGYCDSERDVLRYQGMEFDVIFIDEATQLTEFQFESLNASIRGVNDFPKRMYLTCNPGGVGHSWVKRLFIERKYREGEKAEDFVFIQASVYDNDALLASNLDYVKTLEKLPLSIRRAWLYGDWDVVSGQFFDEFDSKVHTFDKVEIDESFRIYSTMDYGLDMLAYYVIAVSKTREVYVLSEICQSNLIISRACETVLEREKHQVFTRIAPPDLWGRSQESGKSRADIFMENGLSLTRSSNDVESGLQCIRELLKVENGEAKLHIHSSCTNLIHSLSTILSDTTNPNVTANNPHDLTHSVDALRYFANFYFYPKIVQKSFDMSLLRADIKEDYLKGTQEDRRRIEEKYCC